MVTFTAFNPKTYPSTRKQACACTKRHISAYCSKYKATFINHANQFSLLRAKFKTPEIRLFLLLDRPFRFKRQKRISVVEKMREAVMNPRDPEGFQAMWISLEKGTIKYMMRFHQPINLYKLKNDSTTWLTTGIPK